MMNLTVRLACTLCGTVAFMSFVPAHGQTSDDSTDKSVSSQKLDKSPRKMTDRRHPDYVRCRVEPIIGSLAKKRRVCMTNAEWAAHIQEGNRRANQFVADMEGGMRTDVQ